MAEFVQQSIEEMLPELEQMERIELFSNKETRTILKKRKAHEYKLRRKTKEKEDYLQYIQYEMDVLKLVKKRRKATGNHYKKLEIDVAIINRIHKLFKLVCWRFQSDVKLWLSHIEFCKERKDKSPVGNLYTRMLQLHNKDPSLWVLAAQWEMEEGLSMENARGLLQRGLRFNPESQHLWAEYFRMELLNAEKLRKRREILGLSGMDTESEAEMSDAVLEGRVANIVLQKALEAIPENVEFCLSFLPICHLFDFTESLEEDIFKIIHEQYSESELAWEAKALRSLNKVKSQRKPAVSAKSQGKELHHCEKEAVQVFETAVKFLNTEKMWLSYIKYCRSLLDKRSSEKRSVKRIQRTLTVLKRAHEQGKLGADSYRDWADILYKVGLLQESQSALDSGLERFPQDVTLWESKIKQAIGAATSPKDVRETVQKALSTVREQESYPLWLIALEWSILYDPDYTEKLFEKSLKKVAEVSDPMKVSYLDWAALNRDIHDVRDLFERLSSDRTPALEFFQKYIEIENAQPSPNMKKLRQANEEALRHYGRSNTDLWLDYIRLELSHPKGQPEKAGQLHWRALKTLDGQLTEKFVTMYTLLQNKHV